jgi:hypothetical protein
VTNEPGTGERIKGVPKARAERIQGDENDDDLTR